MSRRLVVMIEVTPSNVRALLVAKNGLSEPQIIAATAVNERRAREPLPRATQALMRGVGAEAHQSSSSSQCGLADLSIQHLAKPMRVKTLP